MQRKYRAGFARRELNESGFLSAEAFLAPLDVRCFVVETDSGLACWIVYDLTCLFPEQCTAIREAVAAALGCGRDSIVVHCTHTHSVPDYFVVFPLEILAGQAVAAAREAQDRMQPFRLVEATADAGNRFSILRRKFLPGIGTFTVWYGYRLEAGRPDGAQFVKEQAERVFGRSKTRPPMLAGPLWFDDPVDPLAQGLVFVGDNGEVIGSFDPLFRSPAHDLACYEAALSSRFPGIRQGRRGT